MLKQFAKSVFDWLSPWQREAKPAQPRGRDAAITHVIILDGTMSSLRPGCESNAGRALRLLSAIGAPVSCFYEAGLQWDDWRSSRDVFLGRGIDLQIRRAYGYLASRYRPGDKIMFLGYSRGAFAVRSLAGVIDCVGLLRADCATERNVKTAYRHYQSGGSSAVAAAFTAALCHDTVEIEMIGVWDTVKALGLHLPLLWRWTALPSGFHSLVLGPSVKHGFHALALNETRKAFSPVLWRCEDRDDCRIEQVWFPGAHGDVGGQLAGFEEARPLANIPFVWMLGKVESCGVPLPQGWRAAYPTDPAAPSVGAWRSWGKLFLMRRKRVPLQGVSERLHESVGQREIALGHSVQEA
ncbi:DUF2235 domain-containing protein [Aquicoccus sp. G2-2]|uniref:DUF2235 domain-containing protein n=1 Tax=Aquicoccus sp. G2-2 TaxID=3092120 RepID=UPI002ADF431E|nr:DUF2235 domain-containing protein [Aquicoccus sp. G2-2]MEA1113824.1 DUF2235 domain-containing protein [Aquicoccus sp. G2-2]